MSFQFRELKSPEILVETIKKYIQLRRDGSEYRAPCPFHAGGQEKNPSFSVVPDKGFAHCFGCGFHGDAIDFVMEYEQVDKKTAYDIVRGERTVQKNNNMSNREAIRVVDHYHGIEPLPIPEDILVGKNMPLTIYNPKRKKYSNMVPSMVFTYWQKAGQRYGWVIRVDIDADTKITPQIRWCQLPNGSAGLCMYPFGDDRPLYSPTGFGNKKSLLIVEGEKAADAAAELLSQYYDVATWCGGTKAINKSNWAAADGYNVLLWPDMDENGANAMFGFLKHGTWNDGVGDLVHKAGAGSIRKIDWDPRMPKGWDIADGLADGWDTAAAFAWAKPRVNEYSIEHEAAAAVEEAPDHDEPPLHVYEQDFDQLDNVVALPPTPEQIETDWRKLLLFKSEDKINNRSEWNAELYLANEPAMSGCLAYNEFKDRYVVVQPTPWDDNRSQIPRELNENDYTRGKMWLETFGMMIGYDATIRCMKAAASRRSFHPLRNYLTTIEWDGTNRLDQWLHVYMGAEMTEYHSLIGRKFMIGAVRRALDPGCKMDNMLVLEGKQGIRKSSAIAALFGYDYFTDQLSTNDHDAVVQLQGRWCVEVSEMNTINAKEASHQKEFLSRDTDRIRKKFARDVIDLPRSCVFVGTINPEGGYLKDPTGARRFWPVACGAIDFEAVKADRDQLWAEAMEYYRAGERHWLEGDEELHAQREQDDRYESDEWTDVIADFVFPKTQVDRQELYDHLSIDMRDRNKVTARRIRGIMSMLGWIHRRTTKGGSKYTFFVKE